MMRRPIEKMLLLILSACALPGIATAQPLLDAPSLGNPRILLAISEYHATWQTSWMGSEDLRRRQFSAAQAGRRVSYLHCHTEFVLNPSSIVVQQFPIGTQYPMIKGTRSGFAVCPSWLLGPLDGLVGDEGLLRDEAIAPQFRAGVAHARRVLLDTLASALRASPGDPALSGQLVRFLIDAQDLAGAMTAARGCAQPTWWCEGLLAFVLARTRSITAADSGFERMRRLMPDSIRCRWESLEHLLSTRDKNSYNRLTCSQRDSVNTIAWWLADPLYRVPGNERLVEQETRRMEVALRSAAKLDERYGYPMARGGDALAQVIERYGWPTYTGWSGHIEDREHTTYIVGLHKSPPAAPYTSFEYTLGRIQTIPAWRAISTPFSAVAHDWKLLEEDASGRPSDNWWPVEHFLPSRPLVQLPEGQTVFLRRHEYSEAATALRLSHPLTLNHTQRFDVMQLATTSVSQIDSIAQTSAMGGASVFLRGVVRDGPRMFAIEALGDGDAVNARTRFAVSPPPPLSALSAGEIALSDIALLSPRSPAELAAPNDSLLNHMLPGRRLSNAQRRVTLYWESYGTLPVDSASVSVRVAANVVLGMLRRLGVAAGIASDPNSVVQVQWKDHEARGEVTTLKGPVPVQMRVLSLDLGQLKPGDYTLEISVTLQDGRTATKQAMLVLVN